MLWLRLRGTTEAREADRRVVSGQVWEEFCDSIKAAGATMVFQGAPTDPFTQVPFLSRKRKRKLEN